MHQVRHALNRDKELARATFHHPRGGQVNGVLIHAPTQGATCRQRCNVLSDNGLNPRTRTGRDVRTSKTSGKSTGFSTHAPARGATASNISPDYDQDVSTRPHGARLAVSEAKRRANRVSTHAPARGATCCPARWAAERAGFNPRTRTGRDCTGYGVTRGIRGFNPRARTGAQLLDICQHRTKVDVSTHAPARGATSLLEC